MKLAQFLNKTVKLSWDEGVSWRFYEVFGVDETTGKLLLDECDNNGEGKIWINVRKPTFDVGGPHASRKEAIIRVVSFA